MKNHQGFTLIELVVVIVILGILAAVAVPKFIDMQVEARRVSIASLYGSVRSASVLTRAQVLVQGQTAAPTVEISGESIPLVNGYPSAAGIVSVLNLQGFTAPPPVGTSTTFTMEGYSGSNCQVVYTEASVPGDTPGITMDNSGCE